MLGLCGEGGGGEARRGRSRLPVGQAAEHGVVRTKSRVFLAAAPISRNGFVLFLLLFSCFCLVLLFFFSFHWCGLSFIFLTF